MIGYRYVTSGYVPGLGISILRGRSFREEDRSPAEKPVILSEALGRKLFPNGEDPIGKSFRFGTQNEWRTIVGIATDARNNELPPPPDPEFYVPCQNTPPPYSPSPPSIFLTPI